MSKKDELLSLKLQKLKALEREKEERELLPHLHMHKFYPWSRELFDDWENRTQVLVAANQLGKSSSIIKKLIDLAISPDKWKELWPDLPPGTKPAQWWNTMRNGFHCYRRFRKIIHNLDGSMTLEIDLF